MKKIKVTKWNEQKGYNVVIEVDLKGYETEAVVTHMINEQLDDPYTVCVEYDNKTHYGRFKNPIEFI